MTLGLCIAWIMSGGVSMSGGAAAVCALRIFAAYSSDRFVRSKPRNRLSQLNMWSLQEKRDERVLHLVGCVRGNRVVRGEQVAGKVAVSVPLLPATHHDHWIF